VHAYGAGFEAAPGDPLTQRTFPLFFEVLRTLLGAGVTVVAEAAFQDRLWREGLEPLTDLAELRIVHCVVDADVAAGRRSLSGGRRVAHGDSIARLGADEWKGRFKAFERVSMSAPALEVDTTDGYEPDLQAIVEFVG